MVRRAIVRQGTKVFLFQFLCNVRFKFDWINIGINSPNNIGCISVHK